jgi:hypothetical protein
MLLKDAVRDSESQAGVLLISFGGKEGFKDVWQNVRRNAWPRVAETQLDTLVREVQR